MYNWHLKVETAVTYKHCHIFIFLVCTLPLFKREPRVHGLGAKQGLWPRGSECRWRERGPHGPSPRGRSPLQPAPLTPAADRALCRGACGLGACVKRRACAKPWAATGRKPSGDALPWVCVPAVATTGLTQARPPVPSGTLLMGAACWRLPGDPSAKAVGRVWIACRNLVGYLGFNGDFSTSSLSRLHTAPTPPTQSSWLNRS